MKKLFKNKKFIGSLFSVVLIGLGVINSEITAEWGAGVYCNAVVKCDA